MPKTKTTKLNFKKKICSPKEAEKRCKAAARTGRRIVFTNGCFDIIHPGHVTYLEGARNKGDFLVVALDTDKAVRMLKGPERPINDLTSRLQVMASLQCVDLVTWFDQGNPIPLILKLKPKVLVKGGDWKVADIKGSTEVLSWKGKVFSLPYIPDRSTTNIINKIRTETTGK